ncbi:hypothetical protein K2Y11_12790 [bacterium]|nr:hypothetical protein [bacterium]
MQVKEAVAKARNFLIDVFEDEKLSNIRLEEIVFDDTKDVWRVTFSMMRPVAPTTSSVLADSFAASSAAVLGRTMQQSYKTVLVPDNGIGRLSIEIRYVATE